MVLFGLLIDLQGLSTGWKKLDMDVCFGISLHPCHIPEPDLEIYVYIKDTNTSWQKNVSHSDLYPVEGTYIYKVIDSIIN